MAEATHAQRSKTDQLREALGELEAEENDFSPLRAMALFRAWEDRGNQKEMKEILSSHVLEDLKSLVILIGSSDNNVIKTLFDNLAFLVTFENQEALQPFIEN